VAAFSDQLNYPISLIAGHVNKEEPQLFISPFRCLELVALASTFRWMHQAFYKAASEYRRTIPTSPLFLEKANCEQQHANFWMHITAALGIYNT
jgi:hypothetical protein